MNVPNRISLMRIIAVPVFMIFILPLPGWSILEPFAGFFLKSGRYAAAALFLIASCTDALDGHIARKTGQITKLGKFLDPIADKLLVTAALIALAYRNEISAWVAVIIIARDLIITGLRLVAAGEGIVIAASIWGKIKTIAQMAGLTLLLAGNFPVNLITSFNAGIFIMWIAVAITIFSGIDYIIRNIHVFRE